MARIILFWFFENINYFVRILKFQVQFWHPSDLRLWRTGYVIYVKNDWWISNAQHSRTCLQRKINKIVDPSIPQNHLQSHISMWDTLYKKCCHILVNFVDFLSIRITGGYLDTYPWYLLHIHCIQLSKYLWFPSVHDIQESMISTRL